MTKKIYRHKETGENAELGWVRDAYEVTEEEASLEPTKMTVGFHPAQVAIWKGDKETGEFTFMLKSEFEEQYEFVREEEIPEEPIEVKTKPEYWPEERNIFNS